MLRRIPAWLDLPARAGRRATLAQLGVAATGAALWVLAAPPYRLWPLGWIAMAPILWLWAGAGSARRAGWLGFAAGGLMTAGGFYWFAPMMHQHAGLPWPAAAATLVALAAWQGLAWLLAGRATWWILALGRRRGAAWPLAAVAPVTIVAAEHAWPVLFPYQLAITQANAVPIIQIADLLGASAVTALIVAAAGATVDLVRRGRAAARAAAVVAGCAAASLAYGAWRLADVGAQRRAAPQVRVGLVQPNEPMRLGHHDLDADLRRLAEMQRVSARLEADGAELIVWSEASYPRPLPRALRGDLPPSSAWRLRRGFTAPLVAGALTAEGGAHYNSTFLIEGDDVVARHDKVHRVLGSEWNPLVEAWPSLGRFLPSGFAGGDGPVILPATLPGGRFVRLGAMICFEDIFPRFGRRVAAAGADLLVNQTNDTWFGTFAEPWQHRALAVFRAIELRADMVRAVNTGPSGLVEATGRIGPHTPTRPGDAPVDGLIVTAAVMPAGQTVYAAIGDVLGWGCLLVTLAGWWLGRRGRAPAPAPRPSPPPGAAAKRAKPGKRGKRIRARR